MTKVKKKNKLRDNNFLQIKDNDYHWFNREKY